MLDYQKLTPHELRVLDLMEERSSWTISEFRSTLLDQGNSFNSFKKEHQFRDFLKQRSKLFGKLM